MKLLAKIPYEELFLFKCSLRDMGIRNEDGETFHDLETYTGTQLYANGFERLRIDQSGNYIIGPGYVVMKLNITEEELLFLRLKVGKVEFEEDNVNSV